MSAYFELFKDPRWQRKRLEVLSRDEWTCQRCFSVDKELQVHHWYYQWGLDPWEYDSDTLQALCKDCHEEANEDRKEAIRALGKLLRFVHPNEIIAYAETRAALTGVTDEVVIIDDSARCSGAALAMGMSVGEFSEITRGANAFRPSDLEVDQAQQWFFERELKTDAACEDILP